MDEVRLLRIEDVAKLLSLSRTKVYELVASGQIPSLHVGRSRRVPLRALSEWIDEQTERSAPALPAPTTAVVRTRDLARTSRAAPRAQARPGRQSRTNGPKAAVATWPFYKPWMPRPMDKDEYKAWVAHLDGHPEEKAAVIDAMERYDATQR